MYAKCCCCGSALCYYTVAAAAFCCHCCCCFKRQLVIVPLPCELVYQTSISCSTFRQYYERKYSDIYLLTIHEFLCGLVFPLYSRRSRALAEPQAGVGPTRRISLCLYFGKVRNTYRIVLKFLVTASIIPTVMGKLHWSPLRPYR